MHPNGTQPHILCINHAPEILVLLQTLLEGEGYRVSTLVTIEHELDAIVQLAPDLIIIDYMWTTSDNEWTLLTMMTMDPRTRHIPVILCTGAVREALNLQSHLDAIGVRVVFKPFDIEELLGAVQELLEKTIPATEASPAENE